MKISTRQLLFFLACVAPVGKLILLPARLADAAQNDLLFPLLAHYLLQAGAVFLALLLARREESFTELLAHAFGKTGAAILSVLFALFLLFASLLPLLEQKLFVQNVFYDTLPAFIVYAPFFLFTAYVASKPLSSYGRVWDILAPLFLVGLAGILILSVGSSDFGAVAPAGAAGGSGFLKGVSSAFSWFFDAALLLPLLGKFRYTKGLAWKGALCYLAGGAAVIFFTAVFYGIFQGTAVNQLFGFTVTSKYFPGIAMLGRVDYLFIFLLALVMAFYNSMALQGSVECMLQAFGRKKYLPTVLSVIVSAGMLTAVTLLDRGFSDVLLGVGKWAFWIFPLFSVVVPALMLPLGRKRREAP